MLTFFLAVLLTFSLVANLIQWQNNATLKADLAIVESYVAHLSKQVLAQAKELAQKELAKIESGIANDFQKL